MAASFEDLKVWKKACRLAVSVGTLVGGWTLFAFRDQIMRAALSIPSNIAEGSERFSKREFQRFLAIALGSAAELRTQIYIAAELELIDDEVRSEWLAECREISRMLQALRDSLRVEEDHVEYDADIPADHCEL